MRIESLETRSMLSSVPYGAMADDTCEFMLGDVYVTVVLMESDGSIDSNLENWTPSLIQEVKDDLEEGLQWWEDTLDLQGSVHDLNFVIDYTYADNPVATGYEPISRPSDDYSLWVEDFLDYVGYNQPGLVTDDILAFNNAQRVAHDTNWAFTIFVVNSANDADDKFASTGSFQGAFAFAGGKFFVTPSERDAKTYTHETTHMFWARDEYPGSGSYYDERGYYNTQNINAYNDHPQPFTPEDSIMYSGDYWQRAFDNHTSSTSSLEMIGWKDSDGDGIFDVLDVEHSLEGTGWYDAATQTYYFQGYSAVGTLPNQNSSGLQNDITINKISRIQYRLDGGAWIDAAVYDEYEVDIDLAIPSISGFTKIEIRTIDDQTGVTSPIFEGTTDRICSTLEAGINGQLWNDENENGIWDSGETGLAGWTVTVLDSTGAPLDGPTRIEPDYYDHGTILTAAETPGVTLTAIGSGVTSTLVSSRTQTIASTGSRVFNSQVGSGWSSLWTAETRQLRMDFDDPVLTVSIDAVSDSVADYGRLEIYDAAGNLLGRYTTGALASGQYETMTLSRPTADIAYAIASGHIDSSVRLDNLRFGAETSTTTDSLGQYVLPSLPADSYQVQVTSPAGWTATSPISATRTVTLSAGEAEDGVDFGFYQSSIGWQNPTDRRDVSNDGSVTPIDALQVINDLNSKGPRQLGASDTLPPPYVDVNGDGYCSAIDALQVINHLNANNATLGNRVWLDVNGDGVQDSGEPGIGGVTVELYEVGGSTPLRTTETLSSGEYAFAGVTPGQYYAKFTLPSGYSFTGQNEGTDDAKDSDVDPTTGKTASLTLINNQTDNSWDCGLLENFTLVVESKTIAASSSAQTVQLDVTFDVPGDMQQKLAGYTIYMRITPQSSGVDWGSVAMPDNPVFPSQLPVQRTLGDEQFEDILPGAYEENLFVDGTDIYRTTIEVDPNVTGVFNIEITSCVLVAGNAVVLENYTIQQGVLTIGGEGEGEPMIPAPLAETADEAEGAPSADIAMVDQLFARFQQEVPCVPLVALVPLS